MKISNKIPEVLEYKLGEFNPLLFVRVMINPDPEVCTMQQNKHSKGIENAPNNMNFINLEQLIIFWNE